MKKISILFAGLLAVAAMTGCSEDRDPVYQVPAQGSFKLNTPPFASQYYQLSPEGSLQLTWSQPDYGYAAAANYKVEMSLREDFGANLPAEQLGSVVYSLGNTTSASPLLKESDIATGICMMLGATSESKWEAVAKPYPLYFRVTASLPDVESSVITSNVIKLDRVMGYAAVQEKPGVNLNGLPGSEENPLRESPLFGGSNVFYSTYVATGGTVEIRLEQDNDGNIRSYGTSSGDVIDLGSADGSYAAAPAVMDGTDPFKVNLPAGEVTVILDLGNSSYPTIYFVKGKVDPASDKLGCIYLVGAPEGWVGPSDSNAIHYMGYKLYDFNGDGVYCGLFGAASGQFQFRFYNELTGWDGGASMGAQSEDSPVDITMAGGVYSGAYVFPGKGSWQNSDWAGGYFKAEVDTKNTSVTFTAL